jgi:hypothetical protein
MSAHVTLVVVSGPNEGREFAFTAAARCVVGRDASCDLRLDDPRNPPQVSRRHCELMLQPPAVQVRDLDSQNGTFINSRLAGSRAAPSVTAVPLFDGDTLGVADYRLRVGTSPVLCSACRQVADVERALLRTPEGRPMCCSCFNAESPPTASLAGEHLDALQRLLSQAGTGVADLLPLRDYEVERELGHGGMGVVYLARHAPTGRRVAVKVMLPHLAVRDELRGRFLREIDLVRALRHPHIVEAFDSGCDGGAFFFTMEYCEGGSVDQLLRRRGEPLGVDEAIKLTLQVLDALAYAHQVEIPHVQLADGSSRPARGLVHRDLKPGNLLLTGGADPVVKVADFGLAKAFELAGMSGHTRSSQVVGTPRFCPRQQIVNSLRAGPEVDVWAAACCLYHLLTRKYVRDFPPGCDPLLAALQLPVVPVRQRRPDLPPRLAELIDRALAEEQALAFSSAADFRGELFAVSAG